MRYPFWKALPYLVLPNSTTGLHPREEPGGTPMQKYSTQCVQKPHQHNANVFLWDQDPRCIPNTDAQFDCKATQTFKVSFHSCVLVTFTINLHLYMTVIFCVWNGLSTALYNRRGYCAVHFRCYSTKTVDAVRVNSL